MSADLEKLKKQLEEVNAFVDNCKSSIKILSEEMRNIKTDMNEKEDVIRHIKLSKISILDEYAIIKSQIQSHQKNLKIIKDFIENQTEEMEKAFSSQIILKKEFEKESKNGKVIEFRRNTGEDK